MLLSQRAAWIEILGREGYEAGRRRGRQTQADIQLLAVVERDGSPLALVALALQRLAVPLPQLDEERFDVLAGTQRVDGEVGTGTEILKQAWTTHRDAIVFSACGLDPVIAE